MGHLSYHNQSFSGEKSDNGGGYVSEDHGSGHQWIRGDPINGDRHATSSKFLASSSRLTESANFDQHFTGETRREERSIQIDIVGDKENFEANSDALLPLPETASNHEAVYHHVRNGSCGKGSNRGDNDSCSNITSPIVTEYSSFTDAEPFENNNDVSDAEPSENNDNGVTDAEQFENNNNGVTDAKPLENNNIVTDAEPPENNNGVNEANSRTIYSYKKDILKWIFVISNLILEILSAIFQQLSSPHHSDYALISLVTSFTASVICITEMICKCREEKVEWRRSGKIYWFYHSSPTHKCFGSFQDIVGLVCAILQFIFATITYIFYHRHVNDPIQLSIFSVIFAFGILCSKFCNDEDNVEGDQMAENVLA